MIVLALDTTTRVGSCALGRDGVVMHEIASDSSTSHAERLPGDLIALLDVAQLGLDAVDVFAVATGPGSFTGLRVGIATMQGLAFAMGKPLIGVSALDALAEIVRSDSGSRMRESVENVQSDSRSRIADTADPTPGVVVATWVDAWRGEVYAALYEHGREIESPTVEHPAAILQRLGERPSRCIFIGGGAGSFTESIRSALGDRAVMADPVTPLLAGAIARLAGEAARAGVSTGPDAIRPMYVRRIDAELTRDARAGQ